MWQKENSHSAIYINGIIYELRTYNIYDSSEADVPSNHLSYICFKNITTPKGISQTAFKSRESVFLIPIAQVVVTFTL